MRIEVKAYGRGKSASICRAVGEVRLRADDEKDAEFLKELADMVYLPKLLGVLLCIGKGVEEKRLTASEKRQIADIVERVANERKGGGA